MSYQGGPHRGDPACQALLDLAVGDLDLSQDAPAFCGRYPARRQPCELPVQLSPDEKAVQLLGRDSRRPRAAERVEDQIPLPGRGEQGAPHEAQGLLGRVVAVWSLAPGRGLDAPDGGDLGRARTS